MLAADRSLLEVNLRQSAIKLREKELNLYTENFSAMATQAAVLAGFTTTCLVEMDIPDDSSQIAMYCLHISAIISICANIGCVSISTITSIWGSGKALRGRDGSMDEAVDGMNKERSLIFTLFAVGLAGNLCTVLSSCLILMDFPISIIAIIIVLYAAYIIFSNSIRIQNKFMLTDAVRLDDLTQYASSSTKSVSSSWRNGFQNFSTTFSRDKKVDDSVQFEANSLLGMPRRKSAAFNEVV